MRKIFTSYLAILFCITLVATGCASTDNTDNSVHDADRATDAPSSDATAAPSPSVTATPSGYVWKEVTPGAADMKLPDGCDLVSYAPNVKDGTTDQSGFNDMIICKHNGSYIVYQAQKAQ